MGTSWKGVVLLAAGVSALAVGAGTVLLRPIPGVRTAPQQQHDSQAAGLVPSNCSFDFGEITVAEAASREHRFVLRNASTRPVRILSQTSTCGCMVAELPTKVVSPGESLTVPVRATWAARPGWHAATVFLRTDHHETPVVELTVRGLVRPLAAVSPPSINFGRLRPGEVGTRVVRVTAGASQASFQITGVQIASEHIRARRLRTGGEGSAMATLAGGAGRFSVSMVAPGTKGKFEARVVFRTNLQERPELPLIVTADCVGGLLVVP